MLRWLTLEQIKRQIRMELDFHEEDDSLLEYGEAAEDTILDWCGRTYESLIETYGKVPAPVVQASKLLVTQSYENRSPTSGQNLSVIPYGNIDVLLKPYMIL